MIKNPLIVGYRGEIGGFILQGLLRVLPKALSIWCSDVNETEEEIRQRIEISDVIFLCVPMQLTVEWMVKYKELLRGKTIIEQCSLKEWIYADERVKDLDIRSMHILFRPSQTPNREDRTVGLFSSQFVEINDPWEKEILDITSSKDIVWYIDAKDHDKEMAIQQALVHRTLLVLGDMLDECNGSTFIGKRVKELRDRIRSGDKDLYRLIQGNEYLSKKLEFFTRDLRKFDVNDFWK